MLTKKEKELLRKYLQFMVGFEESSLYLDYKEVEDFTDADYIEAINLLENMSKEE